MTSMLAIGHVVAARFELVRPLATGHGLGTWLAREVDTGREVVLRQRAGETAEGDRLLAAVCHPALLAPREAVADGDAAFDVYDYLPGGELGRLRGRPWPFVVRRLLPIVDALAAMHAAGWVHGDLKTDNVLLDA